MTIGTFPVCRHWIGSRLNSHMGQMTSRLPARPGSPMATLLLDCKLVSELKAHSPKHAGRKAPIKAHKDQHRTVDIII